MGTGLETLDIEVLRMIHLHRVKALDTLLYVISYSATFVSIGLVISLLAISLRKKSAHLRKIFFQLLAVLIIAALVSLTLKMTISRDRPFRKYTDIEKLSQAGSSSFPSGHTLEAFAIAVALSISFPRKKIILPVFAWAVLVAYSRMALGVHYPSDVIGGIIVGSFIGFIIPLLFHTKPENPYESIS